MHEFGLMQSVLDTVEASARAAGAERVCEVRLVIGAMREVVPDAMEFAFEALAPKTLCDGATLTMRMLAPRSRCTQCGYEFEHDRFHRSCPACDSLVCELVAGKEMYIDAIEVDLPA
ncbi:MAG: hydrogenase maturation nickel metallochaperone HypA [Coriobacteriales bacterium]|nr:hydrogenase maturation nickel metallochaperone HypA [Coriobacteriales bacterium]